jgi:hypothetical protein
MYFQRSCELSSWFCVAEVWTESVHQCSSNSWRDFTPLGLPEYRSVPNVLCCHGEVWHMFTAHHPHNVVSLIAAWLHDASGLHLQMKWRSSNTEMNQKKGTRRLTRKLQRFPPLRVASRLGKTLTGFLSLFHTSHTPTPIYPSFYPRSTLIHSRVSIYRPYTCNARNSVVVTTLHLGVEEITWLLWTMPVTLMVK